MSPPTPNFPREMVWNDEKIGRITFLAPCSPPPPCRSLRENKKEQEIEQQNQT